MQTKLALNVQGTWIYLSQEEAKELYDVLEQTLFTGFVSPEGSPLLSVTVAPHPDMTPPRPSTETLPARRFSGIVRRATLPVRKHTKKKS